jgi:UDP-N-acetylmuramoyl-tripeptide--D-alanyl-D-alanine ligase
MELTWKNYEQWLGDILAGELPLGSEPPHPGRLNTDSRSLAPGDWFVPVVGERFDGHRFIPAAMAGGASGFVYDPARFDPRRDLPDGEDRGVPVSDTLAGLQRIATGWRLAMRDLTVLALTGSAGKTTTREILAGILASHAPTLTSPGNFNNEIGVPLTLLRLTEAHRYAAIELAARHRGDIALLTGWVLPDVAACLNVGSAHVGEFGSPEALLATKLEIFRQAPVDAVRIAPEDDPRIRFAALEGGAHAISFGWGESASVRIAEAESHGLDGQTITLRAGEKNLVCRLGTPHASAPLNLAAAAAMAISAGVPPERVPHAVEGFPGVAGRFRVLRGEDRLVVDDAYNANPESMKAGLTTVARGSGGRPTALVLGDMLELGEATPAAHAEIGQIAARSVQPSLLVVVGPAARGIGAGARAAGLPAERLAAYEEVADLLEDWPPGLDRAEVVFVKASRAIGLDRVVERLTSG